MGKIPDELRDTIARNIRQCRMEKFPGRGGQKKCAEAFDVSPQQWSPWECGKRTPDETRLEQIAKFFDKTVEYMRRDNRLGKPSVSIPPGAPPLTPSPNIAGDSDADQQIPPPIVQCPVPAPPGSPESFFWLVRHFINYLMLEGIKVRYEYGTPTSPTQPESPFST